MQNRRKTHESVMDINCFLPEEENLYPLCTGQGLIECMECQLRAGREPEDPFGVGTCPIISFSIPDKK